MAPMSSRSVDGASSGSGAPERFSRLMDGRDYEFKVMTLPRGTSRAEARQLMTEHAEYGRWELARVVVYLGGARRVWLRRRILRVARTR